MWPGTAAPGAGRQTPDCPSIFRAWGWAQISLTVSSHFIAPRVWEAIRNPTRRPQEAVNGTFPAVGCHLELCTVASSLASTTPFSEEEVKGLLLAAYQTPPNSPNPCSESEITGVVRDAFKKYRNGEATPADSSGSPKPSTPRERPMAELKLTPENKAETLAMWERNVDEVCGSSFGVTEADFREASPIRPPEGGGWDDFHCVIEHLYQPDEFVNVATRWKRDDKGRICPSGAGMTRKAKEWRRTIPPPSEVGGWIMPNPTKAAKGSGNNGAICNVDIASCRFVLCEADNLPHDKQLAFWAKAQLPVAAIIHSGKRSYHAWLRLDSASVEIHTLNVKRITGLLWNLYGFDRVRDIRRLSRLPGAMRHLGPETPTRQSLIYLNPNPAPGASIL